MSSRRGFFFAGALAGMTALATLVWWGLDDGPRQVRDIDVAAAEDEQSTERLASDLVAPRQEPVPGSAPIEEQTEDAENARVAEPQTPAPAVKREHLGTRAVTIRGRVLDHETAEPYEGLHVIVFSTAPTTPRIIQDFGRRIRTRDVSPLLATALSDAEGRFKLVLPEDAAGKLTIAPGRGFVLEGEPRDISAAEWIDRTDEVLLHVREWPPPVAGDVRGRLVSESGPWTRENIPDPETIQLDLVSTGADGPRVHTMISPDVEILPGDEGEQQFLLTFGFASVPEGEYELTLSPLDHFRWTPTRLFVVPPAENLEFLRYDTENAGELAFRVLDAVTLEPVEDYETAHIKQTVSDTNGVLIHSGRLNLDEFPEHARFDWSLYADGYAPAFGNETAFRPEEDGRRVCEVHLVPGWGQRVFVLGRDPTMRPLYGAELVLDGKSVGFTGDDGSLYALHDSEPETVEVRWKGWLPRGRARTGSGWSPTRSWPSQVSVFVLEAPD